MSTESARLRIELLRHVTFDGRAGETMTSSWLPVPAHEDPWLSLGLELSTGAPLVRLFVESTHDQILVTRNLETDLNAVSASSRALESPIGPQARLGLAFQRGCRVTLSADFSVRLLSR
jgi:hypothetical protein